MKRKIALASHRRHKNEEELPLGVSPKMMKKAMKYSWIMFIILGLLLFVLYLQLSPYFWQWYSPQEDKPIEAKYDFLLLAQQWPASICRRMPRGACADGGKRLIGVGFSLQGVWPEKEDGTHVANCPLEENQKKFDIKDLQPILPELTKMFPSLTKMPERVMWENDWVKYGGCLDDLFLNATHYYQTALQMRQSVDLLGALTNADITPSEEASYSTDAVVAALEQGTGVQPVIKCASDGQGGLQLDQVWVCVNKTSLTVEQCPSDWLVRQTSTCGKEIRLRSLARAG